MSLLTHARELARRTPAERNRYVDLLRAAAILVVVFGHWLSAAPYVVGGRLEIASMLGIASWSHLLTWALQVMPVFFIVGGFSNGVSWESARRRGETYADWLHGRLRRLVSPLVPLVALWAALVLVARYLGVDPALVSNASRLALIPTWFLAVYICVILLVPVAAAAWQRFGLASFWLPVSAAVMVDALAFGHGLTALRWANYVFVWLAVHQLGWLWRSGRASAGTVALAWLMGGLACLVFLVELSGYPVAMLTVPGADFSNTRPPTVALVALAAMQFGALMLLERPLRRWLDAEGPWTATVLVNGMIMTVFLWHSTVQTLVIGTAAWLGGIGLALQPGSAAWWLWRPAWLFVMLLALLPVVLVMMRFERGGRRGSRAAWPAGVLVAGSLLLCLGIGLLAGRGMGVPDFPWLRLVPLLLVVAGAVTVLRSRPERGVRPGA
jgi:peptidoglycan/LPS O-acetylase OafA/YrhL